MNDLLDELARTPGWPNLAQAAIAEIARLRAALRPFADAADRADDHATEVERLGMGRPGGESSPGLGVRFKHLWAARDVLAGSPAGSGKTGGRAELAEAEARGYRRGLEDAAKCCEDEADKCDDAVKWGGAKKYIDSCKSAAYAMRNRANAIRAIAASADPTPPAPAES